MKVKGFLTTSQAAKQLGITPGRVRQMILDGSIKGVEKVGRDNFIPSKEVDRLAEIDRPIGRPRKTAEKK